MKHVLILRALGFVLVIALAVNITAVLAAPLYLDSGEQLAQANSTDEPTPQQATDASRDADAETTEPIEGDVVQSDSAADSVPSDPSPAPADVETDPDESVVASPLTSMVQSESRRVLFDLGVQIGSRRHRPLAEAFRRFQRRRPVPAVDDADDDLLPTVVITSPDLQSQQPDATQTATEPISGERIELENPAENGYPVRFQLDGTVQTLKPGAVLIETAAQSVIRFDRGGSFGEFRQNLGAGRYQFRVSKEGWKLEKAKADAASL